jgi:DNA-directed RNA polymerase specialized sigma24 family protein
MWPPDDGLRDSWLRLVADPDTAGAFAAVVLPPLEADLARQFPHADPHDLTTAADWAVVAFLRNPTAYDPSRAPLPAFLRLAARGDYLNIRSGEGRHHRRRIPWDGVELTHPDRKEWEEVASLADHPAVLAAIEVLPAEDRPVFELLLDGERDTAVFAGALGIADRPADEQADEVKRAKDRIKARLKRAGGGRE